LGSAFSPEEWFLLKNKPNYPSSSHRQGDIIRTAFDSTCVRCESRWILDATEIESASAALLKLDKNGDGRLTFDEICPPCPEPGHEPDDVDSGEGLPPPFQPNPEANR